ncbi:aspartic proteinase Asp1-like [Melia azedarach]|uniref:Aspartic proteinase Asp1-like n=1 Tax=Melia azedarach TaxID=155640 RepID=A0ACC1WPA1_MELAZ|nr:aspartic proteinase Asp1-like [Melia azedarach]
MEEKGKSITFLLFLVMFSTFQGCISAASQLSSIIKTTRSKTSNRIGSTTVFPVTGNVYPLGYYSVSLQIGNPPKTFDLDIDTGGDLTWVQCDAPCKGCTMPRNALYNPKNNLVPCKDPVCYAIHSSGNHQCDSPTAQCDYEVEYADHGSSLGVLVIDHFPLRLTNGSVLGPSLTFGCGYDQSNPGPNQPPPTAGVLGLGVGKASIMSQLYSLGLTRNVLGHCLSGRGGGYLFLGDDIVPSSGIAWTPMSSSSLDTHYSSGPAELFYGGKTTGIKGLQTIFDSGSSYTYFNSDAYKTTLDLIRKDLSGKQLKDARAGTSPTNLLERHETFQNHKRSYLIVTGRGNVCLGILNGTEVGLGNLNIIGDISLQDKMVIYDNEKQQIGWVSSNCDRVPKY